MVSRYNRQELIIGKKAQQKLLKSTAVIAGMGALGTAAVEILAREGVGKIVLVDRDVIELTDLQRQLLYDETDVGRPKAMAALEKLKRANSEIFVAAAAVDLDHENIAGIVGKPDVVLDCMDNLETRFLLNEYCLKNGLAWVHAAAIRDSAQLMAFDFRNSKKHFCFACVFGNSAAEGTCDTVGILASATATIAAIQATEAMKILIGKKPESQLLRLNIWRNALTRISVKPKPDCGSLKYEYLVGKKGTEAVTMCGRNVYQIKGKAVDLSSLKPQLQKMGEKAAVFDGCISFRNITLFNDGRALVRAESAAKAKAEYSRYMGI